MTDTLMHASHARMLTDNPINRSRLDGILALIRLLAEEGKSRCQIGLQKNEDYDVEFVEELEKLGYNVVPSNFHKRALEIRW